MATGEGSLVHRHQEEVAVITFSRDGRFLASGSGDHTLWVQSLESGQGRRVAMSGVGVVTLLFSPDGRQLFTSNTWDQSVRRLDTQTGQDLGMLVGHESAVLSMALSPEGQRLVTGGADNTVRVWDLESGVGRVLQGHQGPVLQVGFSPDGRSVVSASLDGTVRLWSDDLPLEPQALREWVQRMANR